MAAAEPKPASPNTARRSLHDPRDRPGIEKALGRKLTPEQGGQIEAAIKADPQVRVGVDEHPTRRGRLEPGLVWPNGRARMLRSFEDEVRLALRATTWLNTAVRRRELRRSAESVPTQRPTSRPRLDRRLGDPRPRIRVAGRSSARSGDSPDDGEPEQDPVAPHRWTRRPPTWPTPAGPPSRRSAVADVERYLTRIDPKLGCEREWLTEQVAGTFGHKPEVVSIAVSVLIAEGAARQFVGDCDVLVITPGRSR